MNRLVKHALVRVPALAEQYILEMVGNGANPVEVAQLTDAGLRFKYDFSDWTLSMSEGQLLLSLPVLRLILPDVCSTVYIPPDVSAKEPPESVSLTCTLALVKKTGQDHRFYRSSRFGVVDTHASFEFMSFLAHDFERLTRSVKKEAVREGSTDSSNTREMLQVRKDPA